MTISLRFFSTAAFLLLNLSLPAEEVAPSPSPTNAPPQVATSPVPASTPFPAQLLPKGTDGLILPSDNEHAPYMAVFKGSVNGVKNPSGALSADAYASWLNRKVIWAEDNQPGSWDNVEGAGWQIIPWGQWVSAVPGRRLILGVAIIPGAWDGSGPKIGPDAHVPVSFEAGAQGKYNEHYKKLAEHLVANNLGNSILRLGVEFNGGWFPWRVKGNPKAEAFAAYWRQIVTTMRAVPGAEKLQFCWNPGLNCYCDFKPVEEAWPGDAYVDFLGLDFYDDSYYKDTYPMPKDAKPEEVEAIHKKVWQQVFVDGSFGLSYWKKFAKKHGNVPLAFPEWGTDNKPDHHGGGDDPYFIEQMYKFIHDPANNVAWHSYFDYQAGDGHHQLSPKRDGTVITEFPQSAAKFHERFSLPPAPLPATAAPAPAASL